MMKLNMKALGAAALTLAAAARVTRLVTVDDLGEWWIKEPVRSKAAQLDPRWDKYVDGLDCSFCVGFWATTAVMGAGAALRWNKVWQFGAGVFAASYVVAHVSSRLDADDDADDRLTLGGMPARTITMTFGDGQDEEDD